AEAYRNAALTSSCFAAWPPGGTTLGAPFVEVRIAPRSFPVGEASQTVPPRVLRSICAKNKSFEFTWLTPNMLTKGFSFEPSAICTVGIGPLPNPSALAVLLLIGRFDPERNVN